MNIKDTIIKYGVVFGKRYSDKEKEAFLQAIGEDFKNIGFDVRATLSKDKTGKAMNILIGDVAKAPILVVTHYDTPTKALWPSYEYYPFNAQESAWAAFLPNNIGFIATFFVGLVLMLIGTRVIDFSSINIGSVIFALLIALCGFLSVKFIKGFPNKNNFNQNSMGIVTALHIAEHLPKEMHKKVAFVLTDKECFNFKGDKMLVENLPSTIHERMIIHMTCVASGEIIGIGCSEQNEKYASRMLSAYPGSKEIKKYVCSFDQLRTTSLRFYEKSISIASGKEKKGFLLVNKTHGTKDIDFDIEQMQDISKMVTSFIQNYK